MGKKTLAAVQMGTAQKPPEINTTPEDIRVNGHWMSNTAYLTDPKGYNKMPYADGYLEECGIDPKLVNPDMLPESLKKAS